LKDRDTYICDEILYNELIVNFEKVVNLSESIPLEQDPYQAIYIVFDDLLLLTKITGLLHPVAYHCWNGAENTFDHYNKTFTDNPDPKTYLINFVYNFGAIFDAMREVVLFFTEDPRGTANNVHDAGYNLGLASYYTVTPGIAVYSSDSVHSSKMDYDDLT
jgi:hypothetical protein